MIDLILRLLNALPKLRDLPAQRLHWRLLHWLLACAVFFALVGMLLLAGALYLFAAQTLAPWQSVAITGIVTVIIAAACISRLGRQVRSPKKVSGINKDAPGKDALDEFIMGQVDDAAQGNSKHRSELVLLGLAAGVLLGVLSDHRK